MTWFANAHGGFEGPKGWAELPSLGLVEDLPEPTRDPPPFRASVVLSGDVLPAGHDAATYHALQQTLLAGTLPGYVLLAAVGPADAAAAGLLLYQLDPPGGPRLIQRQMYRVHDGRVAVLTHTTRADHPGAAEEDFARAVETYMVAG